MKLNNTVTSQMLCEKKIMKGVQKISTCNNDKDKALARFAETSCKHMELKIVIYSCGFESTQPKRKATRFIT